MNERPTIRSQHYRPILQPVESIGRRVFGDGPDGFPRIDTDDLMDAAMRRTGLTDWGESREFETALRLLMDDLRAYPPAFIGRIASRGTLQAAAEQRLLRIDYIKRNGPPKASSPLIIGGLHRSGTTLLQNLLSAIPGHCPVPFGYQMEPVPRAGRMLRGRFNLALSRLVGPEMWVVHPVNVHDPDEDWAMMLPTFHTLDLCMHWKIPRFTEFLDQADFTTAYTEYRETVDLVAEQLPARPVVKGPCHLNNLDTLLRTNPNARFIWPHRDPAKSISSFATLSAIQHRAIYGTYDPRAIAENLMARTDVALREGIARRAPDVEDRIFDVSYKEMTRDPLNTIRRIVEWLGEPWDDAAQRAVQNAIDSRPRNKSGVHRYSPEQWGLTADEIRERYQFYIDRFNIEF